MGFSLLSGGREANVLATHGQQDGCGISQQKQRVDDNEYGADANKNVNPAEGASVHVQVDEGAQGATGGGAAVLRLLRSCSARIWLMK